MIKMLGLPN